MKKIFALLVLGSIPWINSLEGRSKKKQKKEEAQMIAHEYKPMQFDFAQKGVTFSESQMSQHYTLYQGYVKKRNEIDQNLKTVDRSNVANVTYSPFRSLKIAQVFAHNGSILHQLFFENLGQAEEIGPETQTLLIKNFGSIEAFKKDLLESASCARGWVLTAYCLDDNTVKNFVLDAHHINVPVFVIPLLVVDTYEHAYMIDFGIDRAQYLKDLWNNIDWNIVESRVVKWLNILRI